MKIKFKGKGIVGLVLSAGISWVFGLYVSGRVGYLMLYTVVLAPIISFIMSFCFSRSISVKVDISESVLAKRDRASYKVVVSNGMFLPTPPIHIELFDSPVVRSDEKKYIVSVMPRNSRNILVNMYAKFCGPTTVGISSVWYTDWLGLFEYRMSNLDYVNMRARFAVIPEMNELSLNDENIMKIVSASNHAEDSDETVEATINTFSGFPGYNSREYIPGDPLKRINWKQSAKRNKLLVRLDDEMSSSTIAIVLDGQMDIPDSATKTLMKLPEYNFYEEYEILSAIAQETVENALGLARLLITNSFKIVFYAKLGATFSDFVIEDESELEYVRIQLANALVSNRTKGPRFPENYDGKNISVFVTAFDSPYTLDILAASADVSKVITYSTLKAGKVNGGMGNV